MQRLLVRPPGSPPGRPRARKGSRAALGPRAPAEGGLIVGAAKSGSTGRRAGKRTILVVDDQPDVLDSMRLVIEAGVPDTEVLAVSSAREALRLLETRPIDLLITDLRMPEMDGLDLARALRPSRPGLPVVLMTAYVRSEGYDAARGAGVVDAFLEKPIDPDRLLDLVETYLERDP